MVISALKAYISLLYIDSYLIWVYRCLFFKLVFPNPVTDFCVIFYYEMRDYILVYVFIFNFNFVVFCVTFSGM